MEATGGDLSDGTYVELVRTLFQTLLPATIMVVSFTAIGLLLALRTHDAPLALLTGVGVLAGVGRLASILLYRVRAADAALTPAGAQLLERRFALPYLSFALSLGVFGARAFLVGTAEEHMLIIGLLFGYGAGVAAGLSLRPWISVPSIAVAVVPTVLIACATMTVMNCAAGLLLALFLGGGIQSMVCRYRAEIRKITMRRTFSTLARHDHLTGLPNRLSLRERFEETATRARAGSTGDGVAVHCLDLDRFKPVNDRLGHPVGDALLQAVADRLNQSLRETDFVARVGGDEFVVIQTGVRHAGEAEMLARRIVRVIAEPFTVSGHVVRIGTSIGYALRNDEENDIDTLIALADQALCRVKQQGGGVAAYREEPPAVDYRLRA